MRYRRWILAAVVAVALGGGAFAYAASLNVTSTRVGAISVTVTGCVDSFAASYTLSDYGQPPAPTLSGYKVTGVTLTDTSTPRTCDGETLMVELTGTGHVGLASGGPVIVGNGSPSNPDETNVTIPTPVDVSLVTDLAVAIH